MNKIPKIIHYCWFGRNPLPKDVKKYIESWKKYCPDYEIKEWNESNFNINSITFVKEAYESRKWAFVSDYVRLYALYNYGGIYMDTDVEVLKKLDIFLENDAFSGFESNKAIPTGIMACKKNFKLYLEFMKYYNDKHFILQDGSLDMTTNVEIMTKICQTKGLILNNQKQTIEGWTLYPNNYFSPKSHDTGRIIITDNTYTIHHFAGSWISDEDKERKKYRDFFTKLNGKILGDKYGYDIGKNIYKIVYTICHPIKSIKHLKKIKGRRSL